MSIFSTRRRPYPFYMVVDGTGLMLGAPRPNQPVTLVSVKPQDVSAVQPPEYSYAGTSPLNEREEPYEALVLGMGMKVQEAWQDGRYLYAQGVDLSVWPWCKGPFITRDSSMAGAASSGDGRFFEFKGSLFRAQGTRIYKYAPTTDTWSMTKDFGASGVIQAVQVFASNFDLNWRIFVGLDAGVAQWSLDGTTFTPMATFHSQAFAVVGREFWWADHDNHLRKCDVNSDPTNEANYTVTQFQVGDGTSPITSLLVTTGGGLVMAKTDGLYSLNLNGDSVSLFPFLKLATESTNGRWFGQYLNSVYVSYGQNLLRLNPDYSVDEIGLEKLVNNDSPVRGRVTAFVGLGVMFAYAAVWDPDTNTSFLMKFGSFPSAGLSTNPSGGKTNVEISPTDAWHGSISDPFAGVKISHLFTSTIDAPLGHTRTWMSFSDGSIGWFLNPCVPNPSACSQYRFAVGDHFVELPAWHGTFPAAKKSIRHVLVAGEGLSLTSYVTFEYRLAPDQSFQTLPYHFNMSTVEGHPLPIDQATTVQANFRIHLVNGLSTECPCVNSVVIGHALRPVRIMQFQADILCADGLIKRDGTPMRIGRKKIQQLVEAAVDAPNAVPCVLPDESSQDLQFVDYQKTQSWDETGRSWRGSLRVTVNQWTHD